MIDIVTEAETRPADAEWASDNPPPGAPPAATVDDVATSSGDPLP